VDGVLFRIHSGVPFLEIRNVPRDEIFGSRQPQMLPFSELFRGETSQSSNYNKGQSIIQRAGD
jgi:hypothetical protein